MNVSNVIDSIKGDANAIQTQIIQLLHLQSLIQQTINRFFYRKITLTEAGADLVNWNQDLPNFTVSASSSTGDTGTSSTVDPASTTDVDDGLKCNSFKCNRFNH